MKIDITTISILAGPITKTTRTTCPDCGETGVRWSWDCGLPWLHYQDTGEMHCCPGFWASRVARARRMKNATA